MRLEAIVKVGAWSLMFLLFTLPVNAQKIINPLRQQDDAPQQVCRVAQANVVYLGETHDSATDHKAQLEILQKLYRQKAKIAVAMEMFQRPYQGVLNRYLAGQLSEQELVEQSEYEQRWGFPWEYYAPSCDSRRKNICRFWP